jgi:hypothetical protein
VFCVKIERKPKLDYCKEEPCDTTGSEDQRDDPCSEVGTVTSKFSVGVVAVVVSPVLVFQVIRRRVYQLSVCSQEHYFGGMIACMRSEIV